MGNRMRRNAGVLLGMILAAMSDGSASARIADGKMPDGRYGCEVYMLGMFLELGDIEIKGNRYSGPLLFGSVQQAYDYQVNANGEISWLGPVGGFTAGGNSIDLTQATADGDTNASFDIIMRQADGNATAATCTIHP